MDTQRREEEFLETDTFRRNAFKIILEITAQVVLYLTNSTNTAAIPTTFIQLVDEILHSIFFCGKINCTPFTPKDIVPDKKIFNYLKDMFPQPFRLYSSHLPKRSPFSCVLDMIVLTTGERNEDLIKEQLKDLHSKLSSDESNSNNVVTTVKKLKKPRHLIPSTMCVSQKDNSPNSVRYYGVSMSTTGPNPGKIVIAASCLSYWDNYVAGAVMTYYPERADQSPKLHKKKSYFDGTFKLPDNVTCKAFNIKNDKYLPPCRSCRNLFGLATGEEKQWPYGNCAEVESVSNLLKNEAEVKSNARPTSPTYTEENRNEAKISVENVLRQVLKMVDPEWSSEALQFYNPQE